MSEQKPKKHKIIRTVKEDEMIKVDERTFQTSKYMIYHDFNDRWLCDCRNFYFKTSCTNKDNGKCKIHENHDSCKHIRRAKFMMAHIDWSNQELKDIYRLYK